MVAAANRCFEMGESRETGAGAFLFRTPAGNPVPFWGAEAAGRKDVLQVGDAPIPALNVWRLPPGEEGKPIAKGVYLAPSAYEAGFISTAHDGTAIARACEILSGAIAEL